MHNASKKKILLWLVFIIIVACFVASLFVIPNWTNKSALLFMPVIEHNKIKSLKNTQVVDPATLQKATIAYLCNSLKKESNSTITLSGQSAPVCKDQDNMSLYKSGMATSYNPTEVTMYNPDGSKYNVPKGCNILKDSCLENGGEYLVEAYCDVAKQVVASKELKCPTNYLCKNGACIEKKCGDGFVKDSEECDDGNDKDGDGCSSVCKVEKQEVDLYVGEIKDQAKSESCLNYVSFKVCNGGNGKVTTSFEILASVESKGASTKFNYNVAKYGVIGPGACIEVNEPQKMNILAFFAGLHEDILVKINLDTNSSVEETDETNNSFEKAVYTGNVYMLEGDMTCALTCYDPDGGFLYPAPFEYSKVVLKGTGLTIEEDSCYWNNMTLSESYCKLDNGIFELADKDVPCYAIDKKCEGGKCVELEVGESTTNLDCDDSNPGDDSGFGEVLFNDLKGEEHLLKDYCTSLFSKLDYFCDGIIPNNSSEPCGFYYDNSGICVEGSCVAAEKEFECNVDTNVVDYYNYKTITGSSVYTYDGKSYFNDSFSSDLCLTGTLLSEATCNDSGFDGIEYDCSKDGLVCNSGACVSSQPKITKCDDVDDGGLDPFVPGSVHYETTNWAYWEEDICLDSTTLVETYCDDTNFEAATIDCKIYGDNYFCVENSNKKGACIEKNPDLQKCVDKGFYVEYTNWFGQTNSFEKECKSDFEAVTYYCIDDKTKGEKKTSCIGSEKCIDGACVAPNPSLESCTQLNTYVKYTDIYGVETNYQNGCKTEFGDPQAIKYVCNGTKYAVLEDACEAGQVCNSSFGICMAPVEPACEDLDDENYFKKSLTISNDKFGINKIYFDSCSSGKLSEEICKNNETGGKKVDCKEVLNDENAICKSGLCTKYDPEKEFCNGPSDPEKSKKISGMITYGDGYNIYNMPQNACYYSTFSISIGPLKTKVFPSYSINTEFCKAGKKADSLVFCDDMCGGEVKEVNGKKGYISDLCINSSELYEDKYLVLSTGYDIFGDFDFYLYASDPPKNYTELDAENLIEEFINYVYLYKTALPDLDENMNICALTFYPESIDPEEYDLMGNVVVKAQDWYVSYNQKLEEIMAENGLEVCYMDQYNPKLWWE